MGGRLDVHVRPLHEDVLSSNVRGHLASLCYRKLACGEELTTRVLAVADWMDYVDLVGELEVTRDLLGPYAPLETDTNWTVADHAQRVDCFIRWTEQRPEELHARLGR